MNDSNGNDAPKCKLIASSLPIAESTKTKCQIAAGSAQWMNSILTCNCQFCNKIWFERTKLTKTINILSFFHSSDLKNEHECQDFFLSQQKPLIFIDKVTKLFQSVLCEYRIKFKYFLCRCEGRVSIIQYKLFVRMCDIQTDRLDKQNENMYVNMKKIV